MDTQWMGPDQLKPEVVDEVLHQSEQAHRHDGVAPLSEQAELALRHARSEVRHLLAWSSAHELLGYVQVTDDGQAEGFVVPPARGGGVGTLLVAEVIAAAPESSKVMWAHGDLPSARALAERYGARRERELRKMSRPVGPPLPEPVLPDGVQLRAFEPGRDEQDWLDVNAAAFASHPEQGKWTMADLHARMAENWFDPMGFIIAQDEAGTMLGFHWTKVPVVAGPDGTLAPEGEGEVYVVGVSPAAQGTGLGRTLTLAGLRHLAELRFDGRPLREFTLYVDAENTRAVQLYTSLGFTTAAVDVQYTMLPAASVPQPSERPQPATNS